MKQGAGLKSREMIFVKLRIDDFDQVLPCDGTGGRVSGQSDTLVLSLQSSCILKLLQLSMRNMNMAGHTYPMNTLFDCGM